MTRFASAVFGLFVGLISQAGLATNYSDWWADAAYGGSSMNISQQGDSLGIAWYFYDSTGIPTWIFGGGVLSGATASVALLRATGVTLGAPESVASVPIGTATITFTSDSAATFAFTYSGTSAYSARSGQLSLQRYTLAPLPIAGSFQIGSKSLRSGCTAATNNGTFYGALTWDIAAANGNLSVAQRDVLVAGQFCTFAGPYVQSGSKIAANMTAACTNGVGGPMQLTGTMTDDSIQGQAIVQYTVGETCQVTFWFGGARR